MSRIRVRDAVAALDAIAPPHLSLGNDPRGLLVGDPEAEIDGIVVALDVTLSVVEGAVARGAGLIVAHHPLVYNPLQSVRAHDPIGAVVLACARGGIAVAAAHTDWDVAPGGVNDMLAGLLGLTETRPLQITWREPLAQVAVFVPTDHRETVLDAMASAGAGALGDYDRCAFWTTGTGTFRPLPGAQPFLGEIGTPETVDEARLEMIVPTAKVSSVLAAMRSSHPYEEVAYQIYPLTNTARAFGIGRIGTLATPLSTEAFLAQVKTALDFPEVRMVGPRDKAVRTVAVCGGAGASLVPDALAGGADAFVTSDIRHHEFVDAEARGLLLLDAGHSATETPGARELARRLAERLEVGVTFVESGV